MKRLLASLAVCVLVVRLLPSQLVLAQEVEDNEGEQAVGKHMTVSGYKFKDLSGEGIWNEGEPALSGWTIYAHKGPDENNEILASDVTDDNGYYQLDFDGWLMSDAFYVAEELTTAWKQTLPGSFSNYEYRIGPNEGNVFINVNFGNKPRLDNGRLLVGYKFDDADNDGIWDEGEDPVADWKIHAVKPIGSFSVPANGPAVNSPVFEDGKNYIVRARGTFDAGDDITADAMYSVKSASTTWTDVVETYETEGSSLLDLQIDGMSPFWGEFNTAHTYFAYLTGTGAAKSFEIKDVFPANNLGNLSISVYEVIDTAVTDSNGYYEVEATGWMGDHLVIVMEDTQQVGWLQTFPGADHDYMHYVSWEEAWNQDWAYNFGNHYAIVVPTENETPAEEPVTHYPTVTLQKVFVNNEQLGYEEDDFLFKIDGVPVELNTPIVVTPNIGHFITEMYTLEGDSDVAQDYIVTFSEECAEGSFELGVDEEITCTITNTGRDGQGGGVPTVQLAQSSGGSGGGGGGLPLRNSNNNDVDAPTPIVLGDTDEKELSDTSSDAQVIPPEPTILGAQDTLPRTGLPVAGLVLLGSTWTFIVSRRRK